MTVKSKMGQYRHGLLLSESDNNSSCNDIGHQVYLTLGAKTWRYSRKGK